jgi:acid phosphatase
VVIVPQPADRRGVSGGVVRPTPRVPRRTRRGAVILTAALALLLATPACGGSGAATRAPTQSSAPPTSTAAAAAASPAASATPAASPATTGGVPDFSHVYIIILENKELNAVVGSPDAPYLNQLVARYGLATQYHGLTHPSQPNYIALISGATQGVTDDSVHDLDAPNLADQLEAHGKTWRVFAQNGPTDCSTAASATDGPDGAGTYVRRHNPFISFTSISHNPARCANITDFTHFDPNAADFEFIVPNLINDMHDGTVAQGDAFLQGFVPKIIDSPAFQNSVLFITWDEGTTNVGGGGNIPTLVITPSMPAGFTSDAPFDHYSLLRTIEDAWGLGCLGAACDAPNMGVFFH